MEHQIERIVTIEHELDVDGQWFKDCKKFEELQNGVVHAMHSQQIGDDKITVKKTNLSDGKLMEEPIVETETNMDTDEEIASFKSDWESGWNPMFGKETDPTKSTGGFFSSLKKALKFW